MVTNIICLPFAGGSRFSYRYFDQHIPPDLNFIAIDLPGRGTRINEPLLKDIHAMTEDVYRQIRGVIAQGRYALFGHSMGGLLAYLLAVKIEKENAPKPVHIIVTGTEGPSAPMAPEEKKHLLDRERFIEEIKKFDGSPKEVLEDPELLDFFLPTLLADFEATENYTYEYHLPLPFPFTVVTGTSENMIKEEIHLWHQESKFPVEFYQMPGNHFFIFNNSQQLIDLISQKVNT